MNRKEKHRKQRQARQRLFLKARHWVVSGTLVACTSLTSQKSRLVFAQNRPGQAATNAVAQQAGTMPVHRFNIPSGSLGEALDAFGKIAALHVTLTDANLRNLWCSGVAGLLPDEKALKILLASSGASYRFTGPHTVSVFLGTQPQSVQVTGRVQPVISAKYPEPLVDTPQSIDVVPLRVMRQQGVSTLRDALRNVAGISLAAGEGGSQGDNLAIRGFSARNDIFLDGMRDFGSYYRDPFDLENVEVIQGPAGVMFGRGNTGGVVNQQSKMPETGRFVSGGLEFGTDATKRATLDVDRPLLGLGSGAAFRLNLMGETASVAGREIAENRRFGAAPSLALGLGTPTWWNFGYFHQDEDDIPDYGIPWLFNGPAPVPRRNYYGLKDANFLRTYVDIGTVETTHDFSDHESLHHQIRYAHYIRDVQITEPKVDPSTTLDTPLDDVVVDRHQIAVNSIETFLDDQLDWTDRFRTGSFHHTLVAGIEGGRETSNPVRPTFDNVPTTSLLKPDPYQAFAGEPSPRSNVKTTALSAGAYAMDTVSLGKRWELTGGVRWDYFGTRYRDSVPPAVALSRVDRQPTYRTAVVYKPKSNGSVYFDYGTSFDPSAESLSLRASAASLAPEKNRTIELGTKWNFSSGRTSLRASVFSTEKTNAREPDPDNPLLDVLAGVERVSGFEAEEHGRLTSRWELLASYALLSSRLVSSQYYQSSVGIPLANVPRNTFTFWSAYHFPWHVEAGGGGEFVGSRTASTTSPFDPTTGLIKEVPGYWEFNAMARLPLTERLSLQLNVYNLTDKYFYDEIHPGHIIPGAGRSALIGLNFKF